MQYLIHPAICEAVYELGNRLDELKKLDWYDFRNELLPILEAIFVHVDGDTLPFTAFSSWYHEQNRDVGRVGGGTLRWPETVAERLSIQLRLVFYLIASEGTRRGFRLAFVPGAAIHGEDVPAYVHFALKPLVRTARDFLESSEVTVEPFIAQRWLSMSSDAGVPMTAGELAMLRSRRAKYMYFVDCVAEPAEVVSKVGDDTVEKTLTAGEKAVFIAAFSASLDEDEYFDPSELDVESNSPPTVKKRFQRMRREVDADGRLFKRREQKGSRAYEYRFAPDDDVSWVVILQAQAPPMLPTPTNSEKGPGTDA